MFEDVELFVKLVTMDFFFLITFQLPWKTSERDVGEAKCELKSQIFHF